MAEKKGEEQLESALAKKGIPLSETFTLQRAAYVDFDIRILEQKKSGVLGNVTLSCSISCTHLHTKQVHSVDRKYADFEWLRSSLLKLYPGFVVPQLPNKKALANPVDAVVYLRRFLTTLSSSRLLVHTDAFKSFLTQTTGFEETMRLISKEAGTQSEADVVARYKKIAPQLFDNTFHILEANEVEPFMIKSEKSMTGLAEHAQAVCDGMVAQQNALQILFTNLTEIRKAEAEHGAERANFAEALRQWSVAHTTFTAIHKSDFFLVFKFELDDLRSYIEQINMRTELVGRTTRAIQKTRKFEAADVDTSPAKREAQENEAALVQLLSTVTDLLLGLQLQQYWRTRMEAFRLSINRFARTARDVNTQTLRIWETMADAEDK